MPEAPAINDCWNKIGVWGKADCPELGKHIHCRNCPTYSAAATQLLNGTPPSHYLDEWTNLVAEERKGKELEIHSAVIFCIGSEWLALSTKVFKEVANSKPIHSLPHRRNGIVLGLVNIRGELLVCVSLARALGLENGPRTSGEKKRITLNRLLVVNEKGNRLAFPVDEVGGIHQFIPKEKKELPATIAKAVATHLTGMLSWQNKSVALIDDQLLFHTLNKSLS
jgi:chemotaxis-related protein WspD